MSNLLKPLYSLTIGEYKELQRELLREHSNQIEKCSESGIRQKEKEEQDIIFMEEVCKLTGYTKPTLYSKISRYQIPVLSRGKPLTFSKKAIIAWIHQGKPSVIDQMTETYLKTGK
jgi:predicted DNA-binding transcriptional regulator AlpA